MVKVTSQVLAALAATGTSSKVVAGVLTAVLAGAGWLGLTAGTPHGTAPPTPEERPPAAAGPRLDPAGDPLPDGAVARLGSVRLRHAGIRHFAVLPAGDAALTVGSDRVLRTWDRTTGRQTRTVPLQGNAPAENFFTLSYDGSTATARTAGQFLFWETATGRQVGALAGPVANAACTAWSPDGNRLAVGTWDSQVTVIEWRTGRHRVVPLPVRQIGMDSTFHVLFSPDGKWLSAGGGAGEALCVFDTATWQEAHRFKCDATTSTVTPDGKTLVAACMSSVRDGSDVRLFDLATGKETARYPLDGSYFSLAVSRDGKLPAGALMTAAWWTWLAAGCSTG